MKPPSYRVSVYTLRISARSERAIHEAEQDYRDYRLQRIRRTDGTWFVMSEYRLVTQGEARL